jgi:hypothetical protein
MQFLEDESESIINALAQVDFYFLSLPDLKQVLIKTLRELK